MVSSKYITIKYALQYINGHQDTIWHNGFNYSFLYDSIGRNTEVSVGNQKLITNIYEQNGDDLLESDYGNYYNPEWGRFINTDSIVGQTGELLGHNMFSYCKNNAVNMSDDDGNRPEFSGTGHDTGEDLEVSLAIMNNRYDYSTGTIIRPVSKSITSTIDKVTNALGSTLGNAISCIGDSGVGKTASIVISKATKPIDFLFSTPKIVTVSGSIGKYGIVNSISLLLNLRYDWVHYNGWDVTGRIIVDGIGYVGIVAVAGATSEIWAPTLAGFAAATAVSIGIGGIVNWATGKIKDTFFRGKK
ncbi:RHS repeat-associated core domain-containing protein [Clostridium sp. DMHC 10]|uniref:RHS repeat-associated core domain-containing protein n=1 Tax=Clostridium sp. DMHC 10 TaxID=747377 RepID=UPI00069E9936|nr:RHS repeat-associated core domain-containing protein [Clostridium sp. DMHC 10]